MNKKTRSLRTIFLMSSVIIALSAGGYSASAESQWLEVRVFDKQSGRAVADASVCLGTTARPNQFGAMRADDNGVVRFEDFAQIPAPLLATVSKQGFQGRQQLLEPLHQSRVLVVKIAPGGGGPECDAPADAAQADASSGLSIARIDVSADPAAGDSGKVLIGAVASGPVNQIRISEKANFDGAPWQAYQPAVAYELSEGKGLKQIHVQVRRISEAEGARIQVVSAPKKVQYRRR